jgi:hypothetical protein
MRAVLLFLARVLLVFCVVEGIASLARVAALLAARGERPLAERSHTEYDAELGWVNRPKLSLPDLYGPGASLHTNAQRFRGTVDVARAATPGRLRAICSGDSFALGYGVDDGETWCHQLEALEPRLETVNMGQGGYGVDQSYLWFRRDGAPLEHHVHLFTFIFEDFARMGVTSFLGYDKPRLRLDGERLVVDNVPVPRAAYWMPWLAQNAHFADELRSVEILRGVARRFGAAPPAARATNADIPQLAAAVFAELAKLHRDAGRRLVLVYLPMQEEHRDDATAKLRAFIAGEAQRQGVPFLDGVTALREIAADGVPALFLADALTTYPAAAGHYTVRGNRWIAQWMLASLRAQGVLGP